MAIEYGTVAVIPKGNWDADIQYETANIVTYNGSSYLAHTRPPVGTLPTNTAYWQVSAQGGGKATADTLGAVKPDGTTLEVDADGTMGAKTATQTTPGIVKGGSGVKVADDGSMDVDTTFQQATELANIIAGEAIAQVLGKVSKAIATTMSLNQNALLKNMLTSIDVNDANKVPTAAYIHTLVERIGMGTELTAGGNLTDAVNILNRDLPQGKAGRFTCSLATGVSYTYHVTFTNPFPDTNYVITLSVNTSNFTYYIANRTVNGFDVIVYANSETSGGAFDWSAVRWSNLQ